jgi:hypothetical protein
VRPETFQKFTFSARNVWSYVELDHVDAAELADLVSRPGRRWCAKR